MYLCCICTSNVKEAVNDKKSKRLRWDKADLVSYYYATDRYLQTVNVSHVLELCGCHAGCQHEHAGILDDVYQHIVESLTSAANEHFPQTSSGFFKSFWDEEMAELKSKSIESHQLWVACGRPRNGPIYLSRCRARAEYRRTFKYKQEVAKPVSLMTSMSSYCLKITHPFGGLGKIKLAANISLLRLLMAIHGQLILLMHLL